MDPEELKRLFLLTQQNAQEPVPATKQSGPAKQAAPANQPFKTGNKYLDEGAVCERDAHQGMACFMDDGQRKRIIGVMQSKMGMVISNYQSALSIARIELLMHKKTGWGPVAELLFDLALSAMTAGIGYAVTKIATAGVKQFLAAEQLAVELSTAVGGGAPDIDVFAKQIASADVKLAKEVVKSTGKLVKPTIKSQFEAFPAEVAHKGAFVTALLDKSTALLGGALDRALENGDDAILFMMLGAYNPNYMTVTFFSEAIAGLLKRFDEHHISDIGTNYAAGAVKTGTTETVLVAANGYSRLAVVRFGERNVLGRSQGETWYTDDGDDFVRFVDDDFAELATQSQRANVGDVKVIDVHKGHSFRKSSALDTWIGETQIRAVAGSVRRMGRNAVPKGTP